jgi:methionyl-tRNA formyltransferase
MQMDEGLDTGDILHTLPCDIEPSDTAKTLHDKLAHLGATGIIEALNHFNTLTPTPQNNIQATYAAKIDKTEGAINWQNSATDIHQKIRAFNPWPIAYSTLHNQTIRIHHAQVLEVTHNTKPGTIFDYNLQGIDVACGNGVLRILTLQLPGKRAMNASDVVNGYTHLLKDKPQLGLK